MLQISQVAPVPRHVRLPIFSVHFAYLFVYMFTENACSVLIWSWHHCVRREALFFILFYLFFNFLSRRLSAFHLEVVARLTRLVLSHSSRRLRLDPRPLHLGFVVDEVAVGVFLRVISCSPASSIPPMLHAHSYKLSLPTLYNPATDTIVMWHASRRIQECLLPYPLRFIVLSHTVILYSMLDNLGSWYNIVQPTHYKPIICYFSCTLIRQCWGYVLSWYGGLALIPRCGRESQQISADESRAYFWSRCDWNFFGLVRPSVRLVFFLPCLVCSLLPLLQSIIPNTARSPFAPFMFIVFIKLSQ